MSFALMIAIVALAARPFAPAEVAIERGANVPGAEIRDVETCGVCHADVVEQWRTSAHAFASFNNPIYRASVDRVRRDAGVTASRMCAGCHDIALLTEGAMDAAEIVPEDPRAHAGITCQTCHAIREVRPMGNGSYTLAAEPLVVPLDGSASSIAIHKKSVAPTVLRTAELCGACHRSLLDASTGNRATFFGMDEYSAWSRSAYAGSHADRLDTVSARTCTDCHMPREKAVHDDAAAKKGTIASHRFLGGHTWLQAMRGDAEQLAQNQRFLAGAARIDVPGLRDEHGRWIYPAGAAHLDPGDHVSFDVVIENRGVGHMFPGGVQDAQHTWLEIEIFDSHGVSIARDERHELRSEVIDEAGLPVHDRATDRFYTVAWNQSVAPRDARAARYELTVPKDPARLPLSIVARLLHRTRNETIERLACDESRSERGRRFFDASRRINGVALDACVSAPVTELARTQTAIGGVVDAQPISRERLYAHGLALSKGLQEHVDDGRVPLVLALERSASSFERAQVLVMLGKVSARQNRLDEALDRFEQAESLIGRAASIDCGRADAEARTWSFAEAARQGARCVELVPLDLEANLGLSVALASIGETMSALSAAERALELHPLDPNLLRIRALSLEALGAERELLDPARRAFLDRRAPDGGPAARAACSAKVEGCAIARNPIPVRVLIAR